MRLLIDNALSNLLAVLLCKAGHDAVHLRDRIPVDSADEKVFELAKQEDRVILSANTDFGAILANRLEAKPSFILLRHDTPSRPELQAKLLEHIFTRAAADLAAGCIISVSRDQARIRKLPLR